MKRDYGLLKELKVHILMIMADKIERLGYSQRDMARYYGITQKRVYEILYIKHEKFLLEKLIQYAEKIGIEIEIPSNLIIIKGA